MTITTHVPAYKENLADHTLFVHQSRHSFSLGLAIGFRSSWAQVADSRIPKLRASLESSLQTYIGQLGTLVAI